MSHRYRLNTVAFTMSSEQSRESDQYVVSASRVKVWKKPEDHPLLRHTDRTHPAFLGKLTETFPPRIADGLPKILSENSEDACTWHYFSPLLSDKPQRTRVLTYLMRQSFAHAMPSQAFKDIPSAKLQFWPKIAPPPSRPLWEGDSEPELLIRLGQSAVVLVKAKYKSHVSDSTRYDRDRDQVIRLLDVGSWYASQEGYDGSYVLLLQYGDAPINAEEVVRRYAGRPKAIQRALPYRTDLSEADYSQLSRALAFVRWPDPLG